MFINVEFHSGSLTILTEFPQKEDSQLHIQLTRSEYFLLTELVAYQGQHLSKQHLTNKGWPDSYVGPNSINVAIMSLRKKLRLLGGFWEITTIQRHGYSLNLAMNHYYSIVDVSYYGEELGGANI